MDAARAAVANARHRRRCRAGGRFARHRARRSDRDRYRAGARRRRCRSRSADGRTGFRSTAGIAAVGGRAHRRRALARPPVAPGGMDPDRRIDGDGVRGLAGVVRLDSGPGWSAGSPAPPCWWLPGRRRADRRRRPSSTDSARWDCPCSDSNGPASMPADPRPTSVSTPMAASCSSRRSAPTSAAPTCCSASIAASSLAISETSGRSAPCAAAVEHEAFVALVARSLGVRTPSVRAFATADPNGYVLAYDAIDGRSLDRVEPNEVTDEMLGGHLAPRR